MIDPLIPVPGEPKKSSMDKLIDINHYLVGRVQELEEIVGMQMQRQLDEQHERMMGKETL